ncbi:MAG: hypothetical protein WC177_05360, partial [Bacilli bacterium]
LVLTALILSVSTYAWFIGMRTVTVSEFSVDIATTKELSLSLDGANWGDSVSINKDNYNKTGTVYADHTNWWAGEGLIPMSSVGKIDEDVSRLILYEKSSITQSSGGYRIMASRAENKGDSEAEGYVAFDLFIRNHTGSDYLPELDKKNEEAIYLDIDSKAAVSEIADNVGVAGTGIENSVRVAFAQIGRVKGTIAEDQSKVGTITGIDCDGGADVTSICSRTAQIWEPNDLNHVPGAKSWYETSCRARGETGTFTADACETWDYDEDKDQYEYLPTYAIASEIDADPAVDVYDGLEYNGYVKSIGEYTVGEDDKETWPTAKYLYKYPTFTDSAKILEGMLRPEFFTLAANSVTKLRIYIWIEGQDIDNYDFASIGKAISVKFGFTKQRFTEEDFNYSGPTMPVATSPTSPTQTSQTGG